MIVILIYHSHKRTELTLLNCLLDYINCTITEKLSYSGWRSRILSSTYETMKLDLVNTISGPCTLMLPVSYCSCLGQKNCS
jgi:hypothetical protein